MAAPELKTLGRYTLQRVLGKGAMGIVYEGLDPKLNRRVAIKTILRSHLDEATAKSFAERFVQEAHAVARLNHPHIVQVHDFGEEGEVSYLVMEFIRGKELKSFFDANERFEIREAVRIMSELCDALEYAHQAGIVHRDVKPGNVMLDSQARTKLTDFGVARLQEAGRTQAARTHEGTMVGTPAYMSPEQISGGVVDRRSDVFSAGIVLYQFLTGEQPFTGGGAWTVAKKIMQDDPPLPSSLNNAVTPYFDAVVNRALAKSPAARFQSTEEFSIALKLALDGKGEEDAEKTVPGAAALTKPTPTARSRASAITGPGREEAEVEFWRSIKESSDPDDFDAYLQQFPNGIYASLATRKLARHHAGKQARRLPIVVAALVAVMVAGGGTWWAMRPAPQKADRAPGLSGKEDAVAAASAGAEKATAEKANAERLAAEKAAAERLAAAERAAREQAAAAKAAEEKANAARLAAEKAVAAAEKADAQRLVGEKAAAARAAAEKASAERLAAEKVAAERAAAARAAADKANAERLAAEKAAAERTAANAAKAERLASEKAVVDKAAAARATAAPDNRLPLRGDKWTYRVTEPKAAGGPRHRSLEATVTSATGSRIVEQVAMDGEMLQPSAHSQGAYVFSQGGFSIFAPYLLSFQDLGPGAKLGSVQHLDEQMCARYYCQTTIESIGQETIRLEAGRFDATKVVIVNQWQGRSLYEGGVGGRTLTIWYSPQTKRALKFSSVGIAGRNPPIEADFQIELVSYKLN